VNTQRIYEACLALGYGESASIEPDGTVWLGADDARTYLTAAQQKSVTAKVKELDDAQAAAKLSAQAKLAALGLTADEIAAL